MVNLAKETIAEVAQVAAPVAPVAPVFVAEPGAKPVVCSVNRCGRGHEWPITAVVAKCPGCSSPVVAIKMENCPVCNEPCEGSRVRTDHMPQGASVAAACKGQIGLAEVAIVEMERTHWREAENITEKQ
jgi:hypothetical protein